MKARLPFWRRRTIGFEDLRTRMMGVASAYRQEGSPPPWMREVQDWALNEALVTQTFSSPWEKALLQTEKERRDQLRNVVLPAIWGAVGGAAITGIFEWLGALGTLLSPSGPAN
jgi:hypothetical protein